MTRLARRKLPGSFRPLSHGQWPDISAACLPFPRVPALLLLPTPPQSAACQARPWHCSLTSEATHQHNTDPFCHPGLCSSLSGPGTAAWAATFPDWGWPHLPEEMLVTTRWGAGACGAQLELEPHTRCSCGINGDAGGQGNTDTACTHCPGDKLTLTQV